MPNTRRVSPLPIELSFIFINCKVFFQILYYCLVNDIENTLTIEMGNLSEL